MSVGPPAASVLGMGAVTPLGRDLPTIRWAIFMGDKHPAERRAVDDTLLTYPAGAAQLRRADRFTRMAVVAASDAWAEASQSRSGVAPERVGLILSSGFGPHCRGFKFLDGILDAGDTAASPTDFSHSVHGAAAAYISRLLDIRGPSLSITDFEIGFEEAVKIAQCWLNEKACDRVLVGATEELGEVYLHCAQKMLGKNIVPGEGAAFFVLGPNELHCTKHLSAVETSREIDLLILDEPPLFAAAEARGSTRGKRTVSFTDYFGQSASSTAFNLLGGLLVMHPGIDNAATVRTTSDGRSITLFLEK